MPAAPPRPDTLPALPLEQKLELLEVLLNDLHRADILSKRTLRSVATEVMRLDYLEDQDLVCFNCLDHEYDER